MFNHMAKKMYGRAYLLMYQTLQICKKQTLENIVSLCSKMYVENSSNSMRTIIFPILQIVHIGVCDPTKIEEKRETP